MHPLLKRSISKAQCTNNLSAAFCYYTLFATKTKIHMHTHTYIYVCILGLSFSILCVYSWTLQLNALSAIRTMYVHIYVCMYSKYFSRRTIMMYSHIVGNTTYVCTYIHIYTYVCRNLQALMYTTNLIYLCIHFGCMYVCRLTSWVELYIRPCKSKGIENKA